MFALPLHADPRAFHPLRASIPPALPAAGESEADEAARTAAAEVAIAGLARARGARGRPEDAEA